VLANAEAPQEGINKLDYYNQKFGADRTAHMVPMMKVTAFSPTAYLLQTEISGQHA
jgi:hypothetical protein